MIRGLIEMGHAGLAIIFALWSFCLIGAITMLFVGEYIKYVMFLTGGYILWQVISGIRGRDQ